MWDISDKRKEEDELERDALMGEGWLEDHTAVIINHHSILMQVTFLFLCNYLAEQNFIFFGCFNAVLYKLTLLTISFILCVSDLFVFLMFRFIGLLCMYGFNIRLFVLFRRSWTVFRPHSVFLRSTI